MSLHLKLQYVRDGNSELNVSRDSWTHSQLLTNDLPQVPVCYAPVYKLWPRDLYLYYSISYVHFLLCFGIWILFSLWWHKLPGLSLFGQDIYLSWYYSSDISCILFISICLSIPFMYANPSKGHRKKIVTAFGHRPVTGEAYNAISGNVLRTSRPSLCEPTGIKPLLFLTIDWMVENQCHFSAHQWFRSYYIITLLFYAYNSKDKNS